MQTQTIWLTLMLVALCGCSAYGDALDQKLTGEPPDRKRAILAQECGQEIAKGLTRDDPASVRHAERMKQICEEMTGQKIDIDKM